MKIFKDDFNVYINVEHCLNLEEIIETTSSLNVDGLNVGKIWKDFIKEAAYSLEDNIFKQIIFPDISIKAISPFNLGDTTAENGLLSMFEKVSKISSTNSKKDALLEYYNKVSEYEKESLLAIINLCYSSIYTYDNKSSIFKDIERITPNPGQNFSNLLDTISCLHKVGSDPYMLPKDKKKTLIELYTNCNIYLKDIIFKILNGNIIPKISEKTFYECFGSTGKIRIIPYQRCEKEKFIHKRARFPMMVQLKADGKFQNIIIDPTRFNDSHYGITLNRSGKESYLNDTLQELKEFDDDTGYFKEMWGIPLDFTGEALIKDPDYKITTEDTSLTIKVLPRKLGNGLLNSYGQRFTTYVNEIKKLDNKFKKASINKAVSNIIAQLLEWARVKENLIIQGWNMVPFWSWLNLSTDFSMIKSFSYVNDFIVAYNKWIKAKGRAPKIIIIWNDFANSIDEIYDHYKFINKELKMEGIVAKNTTAIIEHGVCTDGVIKFKDFKECDLRIVGYVPGDKQFIGGVGSYLCESECGILKTAVAGLTMNLRGFERVCSEDSAKGIRLKEDHDNDSEVGKIINVKFNEVSKNKDGTPSLSLPSFDEFRDDKNVAETYEEIKKK